MPTINADKPCFIVVKAQDKAQDFESEVESVAARLASGLGEFCWSCVLYAANRR
jgi:hypothetical protein